MTSRRPRLARGVSRRRLLPIAGLVVLAACGGSGGGGGDDVGPDLTIDADRLAASVVFTQETFPEGHCAVVEGALPGPGTWRLMRFDTIVVNYGDRPVVVGDPADPTAPFEPGDFEFSPCHGHYHLSGWSDYRLEDDQGQVVAFGHKQAFCLRDNLPYVPGRAALGFDCDDQGLSAGWADNYDRTLDGQWIVVDGVPEGDYWLVNTVDTGGHVVEPVDGWPNEVRVRVHVPDPATPLPSGP